MEKDASGDKQPECYFFTVPGEIRNRIYEFAFAFTADDKYVFVVCLGRPLEHRKAIEGTKSRSPSKSLLRASKQIYAEAKSVYDETHRKTFWADTLLMVPLTKSNYVESFGIEHTLLISDADVALIQQTRIHRQSYSAELNAGVWHIRLITSTGPCRRVPSSILHRYILWPANH